MTDTPIYIIEESKLRRNLKLIASVAAKADIEIILRDHTRFQGFRLMEDVPHLQRVYPFDNSQFAV